MPRGVTAVRVFDVVSPMVRAVPVRPEMVPDFTADVVRVALAVLRVFSADTLFPRPADVVVLVAWADVLRAAARAMDASSSAMAP